MEEGGLLIDGSELESVRVPSVGSGISGDVHDEVRGQGELDQIH